jgi:hypothetical protein
VVRPSDTFVKMHAYDGNLGIPPRNTTADESALESFRHLDG